MKYTEQLLKNADFLHIQDEITAWERERIYCRHELSHALDVCRMAWILFLESYAGLPVGEAKATADAVEWGRGAAERPVGKDDLTEVKDRIYVTGLLHDIGRAAQYETGEHHASAGERIAQRILENIGYPESWMRETLWIVKKHTGRTYRNRIVERGEREGMADCYSRQIASCIARADHFSRNCFCCKAADTCKWRDEERNRTVRC